MELQLPDGTILTDVPDNISREEVQQLHDLALQRSGGVKDAQTAKAVFDDLSGPEQFLVGMGASFNDTALGLKDLFTDLSPAELEEQRTAENIDGWGTAGRIGGEIAQFAIPAAGGVAGGAKIASRFPQALRGARALAPTIGGEALTTGAYEALTTAGDLSERARAGALTGAGAVAGGVAVPAAVAAGRGMAAAGRALPRAVGAVAGRVLPSASKDAVSMAQRAVNVPLTPGQAAPGTWVATAEDTMSAIPGLAGPTRAMREGAADAWRKRMLYEADPEIALRTKGAPAYIQDRARAAFAAKGWGENTTAETFAQLGNRFKEAYRQLWKDPVKLNPELGSEMNRLRAQAGQDLIPRHAKRVRETLGQVETVLDRARMANVPLPGRTLDQLDTLLRDGIRTANKAGRSQEADYYVNAREALKDAAPEELRRAWKVLDTAYNRYQVMSRAATRSGPSKRGGDFTPDDLLRASITSNRTSGKTAAAQGRAALQEEALEGVNTLSPTLRATQPSAMERLSLPTVATAVGSALINPAAPLATGVAARFALTEPVRREMVQAMLLRGARKHGMETPWRHVPQQSAPRGPLMSVDEINRLLTSGGAVGAGVSNGEQ